MPTNFTDKNGGLMAGHSEKWAEKNRSNKSFNAGSGSRASRNQGTGEKGKANTVPSTGIDTSKMEPEEKLKYFKSLGLMGDKPEPLEEPAPKNETSVSILRQELKNVFPDNPGYATQILSFLRDVAPKDKFKYFAQKAYRAIQDVTLETDDQRKIANYVMDVLHNAL